MATKRQQTMAKRDREQRMREKRAAKVLKKAEAKAAKELGPVDPYAIEGDPPEGGTGEAEGSATPAESGLPEPR
jgi:hypothetical protein